MELSALACEAVNCCVQGLRRETIDRVRKKIFLAHNYDAQGPRNISLSNKDSPISRFHALPLSASKSPWPQQRYTANRRDSLRSGCVGRGGLRFPSAHLEVIAATRRVISRGAIWTCGYLPASRNRLPETPVNNGVKLQLSATSYFAGMMT